jgi:hypothetical protein
MIIKCVIWLSALSLILLLLQPIALASVHQYPEGEQQVMWRSLQTLRDDHDRAWQLVLFKRMQNGLTKSIHLRLVGFPGLVELAHPQSLTIATRLNTQWQATEVTDGVPIAPNIGEYDLLPVMGELDSDAPLTLLLPLQGATAELVVPPFAVQEWRRVTSKM